MRLLGYDIFVTRYSRSMLAPTASRPFFVIERGWTVHDTEIILGPWYVVIT
jgi:hypothetical protein